MPMWLRPFLGARIGDRFGIVHFLCFALLFLAFSVRHTQSAIGIYLQGAELPPPKAMTLNIDNLVYENEHTHQHLIGFPLFAKLLRLSAQDAWMLYPLMLTMCYPLLWVYLVAVRQVPFLMATCVVLSIFGTPIAAGVRIEPSADFLTNVMVTGFFLYILHRPTAYLAIGIYFFCMMLVHQRVVVLAPAAIVWSLYWAHNQPCHPCSMPRAAYLRTAVPFLAASTLFFIYRALFYHFFPARYPLRRLDFMQQVRQMFRIPSDHNLEGGLLHYVLSPRNWETWHLLYFGFVVLALGAALKKQYTLLLLSLLLYGGTISQLLVAEDVHRLTSFLFVILVVLAIEAAQPGWPLAQATSAFLVFGLLSSGVINVNKWVGVLRHAIGFG